MPNAMARIKREWWEINAIRQTAQVLPLGKAADQARPFAGSRIAPDRHQRAAGLPELEPPPAGKSKNLLRDLGARLPHGFQRTLEILGFQHDERRHLRLAARNPPAQPGLPDIAIIRPVLHEAPAKSLRKEAFRRLHVRRAELDIIDFQSVAAHDVYPLFLCLQRRSGWVKEDFGLFQSRRFA